MDIYIAIHGLITIHHMGYVAKPLHIALEICFKELLHAGPKNTPKLQPRILAPDLVNRPRQLALIGDAA